MTASRDGSAQLWDAATGEPLCRPLRHSGRWVVDAHFSPDGRRVVTAGLDRTVRVWDAATGRPALPALPHADRVGEAFFSRDGRRILTFCGDTDTQVRAWDAATGRALGPPIREPGIRHAEFSPDGTRVVTAGEDGHARIWGAATAQPVGPDIREGRPCTHATFSPDGRRVATASEDGRARLYDARTGQPVGTPMVHQGHVEQVRFRPDGRWVVTASRNGTARVWDATTGQPVSLLLRHEGVIKAVEFSPDGRRVLTAGMEGSAALWTLPHLGTDGAARDPSAIVRLLGGREIGPGGDPVPTGRDSAEPLWELARADQPTLFTTPPADVAAWHLREARDCERLKRLPAALSHLDAALALRPNSWHAHWTRARVLEQAGRPADAEAALERVLALKPDDAPARKELQQLKRRPHEAP